MVAIADDHGLLANGLARMLSAYHDIAGVAESGKALLELLERVPVDLALLDISMPEQNGLDVLPTLRRRWPQLKIVMLTMHNDRVLSDTALQLGADGFLPKDIQLEELILAIEIVASGQIYVSPKVPRRTDQLGIHAIHPSLLSLTPRQEQILAMVSDGASTARIAESLNLSESTVTFHRANIRRKLGITTEHGLHKYAALIRQMIRERQGNALVRDRSDELKGHESNVALPGGGGSVGGFAGNE
jgi:two-component system nitrate/nitrite response regulator NarL